MLRKSLPPLVGLLLALTACSTAEPDAPDNDANPAVETGGADGGDGGGGDVAGPDPGAAEEYVALGDSYTAAFQTGPSDATDGCFRSEANYPNLVAEATGAALTDVSCAGATTAALTDPQSTVPSGQAPPQLDALSADTDLVTLRLGGNDFNLFPTLAAECVEVADRDPQGSPCRDANPQALDRIGDVRQRLVRAIERVESRAPGATVLAVGYPEIVPAEGTCALLPIADGDYDFARELNRGFNRALRSAARATGITYVDAFRATAGHHICADEPWIAGARAPRGSAVPYHPYPEEQQATAEAVVAALR